MSDVNRISTTPNAPIKGGSPRISTTPNAPIKEGQEAGLSGRSAASSTAPTISRAKQSLLAFQIEVFFADVMQFFSKLITSRSISTTDMSKRDPSNILNPDLPVENTLLIITDLADNGMNAENVLFSLQDVSPIRLRQLAENIRNAKEAGSDQAFDQCIMTSQQIQDNNKKIVFENAKQLLSKLETGVNSLLQAKVEGYEWQPAVSQVVLPQIQKLYDFNVTEYKGSFSPKFSKEVFDNTVNNIIIPTTAILESTSDINKKETKLPFLDDARKEIERRLDNANKPNSETFIDEDNHKFSLKERPPYPKDDVNAKRKWISDFIKESREFYVDKYGEDKADAKLLRFSERIIGLEHFTIEGEDVIISEQLIKDIGRMPYNFVDEKGKNIELVNLTTNPCPTGGNEKPWIEARIKSLMTFCGYVKGGNLDRNKQALQNLKILSSVANQRLGIACHDKSRSVNSAQRLNGDISFVVPANVMTNTIIISKEKDGGFLARNVTNTSSTGFNYVFSDKNTNGVVLVDAETSFCKVDTGIYLSPGANGELTAKEYQNGSVDYRIVEKK